MSELSEYAMRLLTTVKCSHCGHEQSDTGSEQICEECNEGPMNDRLDEARETMLAESFETDLIKNIGETSKLDYLLKLEKFFDDRDLYLYSGWEDAEILGSPNVSKFWVSLDMKVSKDAELKGILRCTYGEDSEQNTAKYKQLEDGNYYVRVKVLRRLLDKIEMTAKDRAEDIADLESEV